VSINKEIEDTKTNVGGQIGHNTVISLQKYADALSAMQQTVQQSLELSAAQIRDKEKARSLERVKETEEASKKILAARKAEYDQLKTLENESRGLLDKNISAQDKEIEKLNTAVEKWTEYKLAWEAAHNGISAVANQNIERLQKEMNLLKAQADAAIDEALKAVAVANQMKDPFAGQKQTMPLYGGTKEAMDLLKLQTDQTAALKDAEKVYTQTRTAAEQYAQEMAELNILLRQGAIDQDTYNRAAAQAKEKSDQMSKEAQQLGKDIGTTIAQAALFGRSWSDAFRAIAIQLAELILKMTLFKGLTSTSSGGGGFWSSLLGGLGGGLPKLASGGPVDGSHAYLVGENGPEIFAPGASGRIIPNNMLSGTSRTENTVNEFHFHGVTDADSFRKSQSQIAGEMLAVMSRAQRRNG
jgi:hypothetical protein